MTSLKKLLPALALGIAAIPAFAGDEPALDKADTAWIMVAGLLVLFMTIPGIALFYAGMVRKKNMLSTLAQSVAICGLMSILWYAVGYSLAFSEGTPFIGGLSKAFLSGISISTLSGSIPELLFVFFQMTFAILTPALITGSLAERMKFSWWPGVFSCMPRSATGFGLPTDSSSRWVRLTTPAARSCTSMPVLPVSSPA